MNKIAKVSVSGRCHPRAKKLLEESHYNAGDAVDFFTRAISHPKKRLKLDIQVTKTEIEDIKRELLSKEIYLEELEKEYESMDSVIEPGEELKSELINSSVSSLRKIMSRLACSPGEINKFTGKDTLGFHAQRCDVSKDELIGILSGDVGK